MLFAFVLEDVGRSKINECFFRGVFLNEKGVLVTKKAVV